VIDDERTGARAPLTVRSDRRYRFDVGRATLWTALTRVDRYPSWWPWLRRFDGQGFSVGERWCCVVSPPLPYTLRFELVLEEVVEGESARARLEGDIAGTAHLTVRDVAGGCELRLVSDLAAERGLVRLLDRVAPRLAVRGHDWVIDDGIRRFRTRAIPRSGPR
jgi:hypothetical protein